MRDASNGTQVTIHNCLLQADLKTPYVQHLTFNFDHVFDEEVSSLEVYKTAAKELVQKTRRLKSKTSCCKAKPID